MHRIRATMVIRSPARKPYQLPEWLENPVSFCTKPSRYAYTSKILILSFQNFFFFCKLNR